MMRLAIILALVLTVSGVAAAGDCSAISGYTTKAAKGTRAAEEAFVVTEAHGHWDKPEPVPGLARLNTMGTISDVRITCSVPGSYVHYRPPGAWRQRRIRPGHAQLPDARDCTVAGVFTSPEGQVLPFTLTKTGGRWGTARPLPGAGRLDLGANGSSAYVGLSCPAQSSCALAFTAVPTSAPAYAMAQVYTDAQVHGDWGPPRPLGGDTVGVIARSCGGPGSCVAGGQQVNGAFLAMGTRGTGAPRRR
jgi:hypothetical protein